MQTKYIILIIIILLSVLLALFLNSNKNMEKPIEKFKRLEGSDLKKATFAGGCFWGVEKIFQKREGVVEAISGYTGGDIEDPSYEEVSGGDTGHYEAVRVYYDSDKIAYKQLLDLFWKHIDPTDSGGQSADRGSQYQTAIFYHNKDQKDKAEESKLSLENSKKYKEPIVTKILSVEKFYPAEKYHQDYLIEGSNENTCTSCGATKNTKEDLTSLQQRVTQKGATEPAFNNKYWDNEREGIYVDLLSGEPLFSSKTKFKSGSGWPSFYKPIDEDKLKTRTEDDDRTEVISKSSNSHLGHLFMDGPEPTGKRYCVNSAALKFIPRESLEQEGYEKYEEHFEKKGE